MHVFTNEDYVKISNWLKANAVKDSDLQEVNTLSLEDIFTVVNNENNKKINIDSFLKFIIEYFKENKTFDDEIDVEWKVRRNLNAFVNAGIYNISGIRVSENDNMPISNVGDNASISAKLFVTESPEGATTYRSIIGQTLLLSNAEGHETKIYTRSANKTSKDGGATYEVTWGDWQVCQGMKEVGLVSSYDSFIDNGMYSGIYNNNDISETFVIITINDYVVKSQFNQPKSISQLKFALNAITNKSELSIRVGGGQTFAWGEWKPIFDAESITTQITDIQNQLNALTEGTTGNINDIVNKAVNNIVGGAPEAFDTLKEIADYIAEDMGGAEEMFTSIGALKLRVHELGDFPTAKDAEDKAREPIYSGSDNISIIHYTINRTTDGLILQHQDIDNGYYRSLQTLFYHSRVYVRFVWFTDSTRTVLLENANFNRDWWETSISHLEYDKTTHTIKCRRIGQDVNSTKWITLPSASTSTDGLMTMAQVKSLEGKQDKLANYTEEAGGNTTIQCSNGAAKLEVSNTRVALFANDKKVAIAADANGTRMLYQKTAEDGSIEHRDEISIGKHDENGATHITLTSKSTTEDTGEKITNTSTIQVTPDSISMSSPEGEINDVVKEIIDKLDASAIINDLTTGGADNALSAEMGKTLSEELASKASSESVSNLRQELATKAPKSGYAPDLKVNFAKELIGRGEATPEVIGGIRPTGEISIGDGNATVERIKGESVVWNQLLNNMSLPKTGVYKDVEVTNNNNGTFTVNGTPLSATSTIAINFGIQKYGHKYLFKGIPSKDAVTETFFRIHYIKDGTNDILKTVDETGNCFFSLSTTIDVQLVGYLYIRPNYTVTNKTYAPKLYDLTQMFGAGNEPTTIEEFEARKPLNVINEYNEGTIVSYNGDALKSVGFNAWNEEWEEGIYDVETGRKVKKAGRVRTTDLIKVSNNTTYCINNYWWSAVLFYDRNKNYISYKYITGTVKTFTTPNDCAYIATYAEEGYGSTYKNNVCINLSHTGYRNGEYAPYEAYTHPLPDVKSILDANGNQLFPYGLLSAGGVHDEITATKAIKRVGVVDMGALTWRNHIHGFTGWPGRPVASNSGLRKNLICAQYSTYTPKEMYTNVAIVGITGPQSTYWTGFFLADSKYSTGEEVKQALQGVLLYYELAEPIEVDLPEPLNMTYEAWDFGTEELIAEGVTTPLNADIVYQFNAVDRIRENSSAIKDKADKTYVDDAIANAITTTLNTEV